MELIWQAAALMLALILMSAIFLWLRKKKLSDELYKKSGKHPLGHYQNMWSAIGLAAGLALGFLLDAFRASILLCSLAGILIGAYLEDRHRAELRPRTSDERKMDNENWVILATLLSVGVVIFMVIYIHTK